MQVFLVNGDFEYEGERYSALTYPRNSPWSKKDLELKYTETIPGWAHHGGGGNGIVVQQARESFLRLGSIDAPSDKVFNQKHNQFFLPSDSSLLQFAMRTNATVADSGALAIKIGDDVVELLELDRFAGFVSEGQCDCSGEVEGKGYHDRVCLKS